MCGIFGILNTTSKNHTNQSNIYSSFEKGKKRGPEFSTINLYNSVSKTNLLN